MPTNLITKAKQYDVKYNSAKSPDYIKDLQLREKNISDLLVKNIGDTYGSYSEDTLKFGNKAEINATTNWSAQYFGSDTIYLKNMEKDSLVCRHYAPIASLLLNEAGIPNYLVCSKIARIRKKEDEYFIDDSDKLTGWDHMFVITKSGNAVVEATRTGMNYDKSMIYRPILNYASTQDIMKAKP